MMKKNFSAGHDLEGLGDSKSTNKEVVAAAVEGVVGSGYHTGEGESIERNVVSPDHLTSYELLADPPMKYQLLYNTLSFFLYTCDSFANVHNDASQGGNGKSTIRMRRDKILTLGHFKRLMIMLFLCSYFSSCYVAADDIKVSCLIFFRSCC